MGYKAKNILKKLTHEFGEKNIIPEVKDALIKCSTKNKVIMGRAKRGLYAGRHIQFGNQISEDGGNKSRRSWKPNVQKRRLYSYIMDRQIRVKVTTHALRCIDKAGGVDEYLLKTPYHKMGTEIGVIWKARIERLYDQLAQMQAAVTPEDSALFRDKFRGMNLAERSALVNYGPSLEPASPPPE